MDDIWTLHTLRQEDLTLKILPGIGGRLWDVVYRGRSLLFQNPDLVGRPVDLAALPSLPTRSPQFGFPLWGGEKTWVAPDSAWIDGAPFPVLDSAPYESLSATATRIEMQSPVCPLSQLQITREIALEEAGFSITHRLSNRGQSERVAGIWSVMMLRHPTTIEIPEAGPSTTVFGTPTPFIECQERLRVQCDRPGEFKFGVTAPIGETLIQVGADPVRLSCTVPGPEAGDTYAHGHNLEVFNSGVYPYCEAEWHAPARALAPGDAATFRQVFHLSD